MVTWKLWRALNFPYLRSPLYRRAYQRQRVELIGEPIHVPLGGLLSNLGLVVLPAIILLIGAPIAALLFYIVLLTAPLLLPICNSVYGALHAVNASSGIARERQQQTYDVLCTSPSGTLGIHWSYCVGWLHYHVNYRYVIVGALAVGLISCLFGLAPQVVFSTGASIPAQFVRSLTLAAFFALDYVESIVTSSLVSLLVPVYAENEASARLWASSLFLLMQVAVYLPTLLVGVFALPNTLTLIGFSPALADLLIPPLLFAFFAVLRESMIAGLWHAVKQQLSADAMELDAITHVTV